MAIDNKVEDVDTLCLENLLLYMCIGWRVKYGHHSFNIKSLKIALISIIRWMDKINCGVFLYSHNGLLYSIKMNEVINMDKCQNLCWVKKGSVEESVQLLKALTHAKTVLLFYKYICDISVKIWKGTTYKLQDSGFLWNAGKGLRSGRVMLTVSVMS